MARSVIVEVSCDVCGAKSADPDKAGVRLGYDGQWYALDLCADHAVEIRESVASFLAYGTLEKDKPKNKGGAKSKRSEDLVVIRAWARANGFTVSDRGRVASEIIDAYNAAHGALAKPPVEPEPESGVNPDDAWQTPQGAPDTAQQVKLHDPQVAANEPVTDELAGTAATMSEPTTKARTIKGKVTVGGTKNPDGTPVKA